MGADLRQDLLGQTRAGLAVGAGLRGGRSRLRLLAEPPGGDTPQGVAAGGAALQDLSQKGPEGYLGREDAFPAVLLFFGTEKQSLRDELTEGLLVRGKGVQAGGVAQELIDLGEWAAAEEQGTKGFKKRSG